ATTAHTEVPGEHKAAFPPFNPQTFASQLFWLVVTFVLLYAIMAKVALPRVGAIIANRQKHIADDFAEAEQSRAQSDAAIAAYEKALADSRDRARGIPKETRERQAARASASHKRLEDELNIKL